MHLSQKEHRHEENSCPMKDYGYCKFGLSCLGPVWKLNNYLDKLNCVAIPKNCMKI